MGSVAPQSMSIVLSDLEAKGLIRRQASKTHRRVWDVHLTDDGEKLTERADAAARDVEQRLDAALGAQGRTSLRELLEAAISALA